MSGFFLLLQEYSLSYHRHQHILYNERKKTYGGSTDRSEKRSGSTLLNGFGLWTLRRNGRIIWFIFPTRDGDDDTDEDEEEDDSESDSDGN